MTLAQAQALFHDVIARGPGADPASLEACFAGTPELPAAERVAIYSGMFLQRQLDALREELPLLAGFLGEERFASLGRDYLAEHPSEHHDIGRLGRRMASFLERHPDPDRPDLGSLAGLEWARSEAFLARAAEAAGPGALAAVPAQAFAGTRLRLVPSLRLLLLPWDGAAPWRALEAGEEPAAPVPGPAAVAVWRSGWQPVHASLDLDEAAALEAALRGEPLGRVCSAFVGREDPAAAAHAALSSWLEEGWVAEVAPPG